MQHSTPAATAEHAVSIEHEYLGIKNQHMQLVRIEPNKIVQRASVRWRGVREFTYWLKDGERNQEIPVLLGQELERNCRVDRHVSAEAEADEEREDDDVRVRVHEAEQCAKERLDGDGEVERPAAADDVHEDAPHERARSEADGEDGEDGAVLVVWDPELGLHARHD